MTECYGISKCQEFPFLQTKKLSFTDALQNEGLKACNFIKKRPQHCENWEIFKNSFYNTSIGCFCRWGSKKGKKED